MVKNTTTAMIAVKKQATLTLWSRTIRTIIPGEIVVSGELHPLYILGNCDGSGTPWKAAAMSVHNRVLDLHNTSLCRRDKS